MFNAYTNGDSLREASGLRSKRGLLRWDRGQFASSHNEMALNLYKLLSVQHVEIHFCLSRYRIRIHRYRHGLLDGYPSQSNESMPNVLPLLRPPPTFLSKPRGRTWGHLDPLSLQRVTSISSLSEKSTRR